MKNEKIISQIKSINVLFKGWDHFPERTLFPEVCFKDNADTIKEKEIEIENTFSEAFILIDQLCIDYLKADKKRREEIREIIKQHEFESSLLTKYCYKMADKLIKTKDKELLMKALAAFSIENCKSDYRDTFSAIYKLAKSARKAKIKAKPLFKEIGKISCDRKSEGGCTISIKKLLETYYDNPIVNIIRWIF